MLNPLDESHSFDDETGTSVTDYEDRYVCFIDILGFREVVNSSVAADSGMTPMLIARALALRHDSVERAFCDLVDLRRNKEKLRVHSFSDCVVASTPSNSYGLALILYFCWHVSKKWLSHRFMSRGGISTGKLIHRIRTGQAPMVFGPAFNQAYQVESEIADFPRIVLSRHVRLAYEAMLGDQAADPRMICLVNALVSVFDDGPSGLDLFCHLRPGGMDVGKQCFAKDAKDYQTAINAYISYARDNPRHFRKVSWLVKRFNHAIENTAYAENCVADFREI